MGFDGVDDVHEKQQADEVLGVVPEGVGNDPKCANAHRHLLCVGEGDQKSNRRFASLINYTVRPLVAGGTVSSL